MIATDRRPQVAVPCPYCHRLIHVTAADVVTDTRGRSLGVFRVGQAMRLHLCSRRGCTHVRRAG